jgi:hypothetical protein
VINARSVQNKTVLLNEYIQEKHIDLLAITETWLKADDFVTKRELCPDGYKFVDNPRPDSSVSCRGGGIGLVYQSHFKIDVITLEECRSFEYMAVQFKTSTPILLVIIYRPPPSRKNKLTNSMFADEFEEFVGLLATRSERVIIMGDFNLHWDEPDNIHVKRFRTILDAADFHQHVHAPTHKGGHTLDYLISRSNDPIIESLEVQDDLISDHKSLLAKLNCQKPICKVPVIRTRRLKKVNFDDFRADLEKELVLEQNSDTNYLVKNYNKAISNTLNKHAPFASLRLKGSKRIPWYSDAIHEARQKRRRVERLWRKSHLEVHRQMFLQEQKQVADLISKAKHEHFQSELMECDSKQMFKVVKHLTCDTEVVYPSHTKPSELATKFVDYFDEKIGNIRNELDASVSLCDDYGIITPVHSLDNFECVSYEVFQKIFKKLAAKSCVLDPAPTKFLLHCKDLLTPIYMNLVNSSITSSVVPEALKHAVVRPLIKKPNLDREILKNYRPVSNLPFLAKVVEKIIAEQLMDHMKQHNLYDNLQSAYRPGHSCETALLKLKNDINMAFDKGKGILLVSLDLSSAFDTLDHTVLLHRLHEEVGICGNALQWFTSYLTGKSQSVVIGTSESVSVPLNVGVPQGSILGPLLFCIYIMPLRRIFNKYNVLSIGYADDNFLYVKFDFKNKQSLNDGISALEKCIKETKSWMTKTN